MTRKEALFGIVTVFASTAALLLLTEVILRFLPVAEGLRNRPVTREQPVATFYPDEDVVYSRDWNFSIVNRVRVNDQGFVNEQDYDDRETPALAVIGDSYVEALVLPYAETLHGRLDEEVRSRHGGKIRVYSFAMSGAPLSQYLVFARHARQSYNVAGMVFVVVGNDFDESLPQYRFQTLFHQFRKSGEGYELFLPREYHRSSFRDLLRHSALVRYLFFNLHAERSWQQLRAMAATGGTAPATYVGNTWADMPPDRMAHSQAAVDAFLRLVPEYSGLPPGAITFVADAPRRSLYELETLEDLEDSYFTVMRRYFVEQARARGYEVLDMAPDFFAKHKRSGVVFEWPTDGHWNAAGHDAVYQRVRNGAAFRRALAAAAGPRTPGPLSSAAPSPGAAAGAAAAAPP